jgi:UDP-xylose/UDP-N-acetylglucosamine transporter B4
VHVPGPERERELTLGQRVTSVTTNLVLTARKAASLCLSVWWFGAGVSTRLALGATLVFAGTVLYAQASAPRPGGKTKSE